MPNHYHFLVRKETERELSKFVNVVFNGYVQAVNVQLGRTGTLLEGRFRHKCVAEWEYLIHLCRYIHRNPVKAHLVTSPEEWQYSNYQEWIGTRNGLLKDTRFIRDHFPSAEEYRKFISDMEDENQSLEKIRKYIWD